LPSCKFRLRCPQRLPTLFGFLLFASQHPELLSDGSNIWIWLIQSIGVLGAVGSIVVFYNAFYVWTSDRYQIWGKLQATMFALACLGVLWLVFAGASVIFQLELLTHVELQNLIKKIVLY
jgi:hypothetical protein